jgi:lysophospholipase L1-like esterase
MATSTPPLVRSFAVVGDSITAGSLPLRGDKVPGAGPWIPVVDVDPLDLTGGLAVPGATTEDLSAAVTPLTGDLLVIMAGTNDLFQQVPWLGSATTCSRLPRRPVFSTSY